MSLRSSGMVPLVPGRNVSERHSASFLRKESSGDTSS
jgi:hypothetical protein